MSEPTREFEERLKRMRPRRISAQMQDAVGRRLTSSAQASARDWPMLCAIGSGLAAACVIIAMLVQQSPARDSGIFLAQPMTAASSPQDPPAIYAFNLANNSWLDESRRVR